MKFARQILGTEERVIKEDPEERVDIVTVPVSDGGVVSAVPTTLKESDVIVEECPIATPNTETEPDLNISDSSAVKSTFEDRFKIPEFHPTLERVGRASVKVDAADIVDVDTVDEVPVDADVVDGIELDGEASPEVEEAIYAKGVCEEPDDADLCEDEECVEGSEEACDSEESAVEESSSGGSDDKPFNKIAWDKFVDNVIVPTLCTCIEKTKDFVKSTLSEDLKNSYTSD